MFINPMSGERVCDCENLATLNGTGFTVTSECVKKDVDECHTNHGNCHAKAECINYDATSDVRFSACKCKQGWHGDGSTKCDLNQFMTKMRLRTTGHFDKTDEELLDQLLEAGVIPLGITVQQITMSIITTFH
jgi:hypothetical protein